MPQLCFSHLWMMSYVTSLTKSSFFVYSDDIFIFFYHSQEEHIVHVCDVLHRRLKNKLFVKAKKMLISCKNCRFLGLCGGKEFWEQIVWRWRQWQGGLQRSLGFVNFYRCFIRNYSRIAAPLVPTSRSASSWCPPGHLFVPHAVSAHLGTCFSHCLPSRSPLHPSSDTAALLVAVHRLRWWWWCWRWRCFWAGWDDSGGGGGDVSEQAKDHHGDASKDKALSFGHG